MKMMSKLLPIAAVCAAALVAPLQAVAQAKIPLKLGWTTTDSPSDPYAIGAHAFKQALEANPNGKAFDVQLYPNRQLGDEKAMLEGLRMGTAQAAIITNAVVAQMEPSFLLNDLPFLFSNSKQAYDVLDGEVGKKLSDKLATKGITVGGYMAGGFRNMVNNVRPVTKPEDISGVKFRVMQSPIYIGMYQSLGGSPVPMAWGETYTAVQQGALDGLEIPLSVVDSSKTYEITKYLSLTQHTFSVIEMLFNKRWLDRLTPEQRDAIMSAAKIATDAQRKASDENAVALVGVLSQKGMIVNEVSDPAQFRAKVKPVYDEFRGRIGADVMDLALSKVN